MSEAELSARLDAIEARLAALEQRVGADRLTAEALDSIWAHLDEKGLSGFPERVADEIVTLASSPAAFSDSATDRVTGRIEALEEKMAAEPVDRSGRPVSSSYDRRFLALARQVKALKDSISVLEDDQRDTSVEVLQVLRSPEFKELFNSRMAGILNRLKSEIVPNAIKKLKGG